MIKIYRVCLILFSILASPIWAQSSLLGNVDLASDDMTKAEMSRDDLIAILHDSTESNPADLRNKRLSGLDLSGVDFKGANMKSVRMNNTNLENANLSSTVLDLAWVLNANLDGANLNDTSLFSTQFQRSTFINASMQRARVVANFNKSNLTGADLTDAHLAPDMKNQSMGLMRAMFGSATLDNANLSGVKASRVFMEFASLYGAILDNADFTGAEMAGVDFTQASVKGLIVTDADLQSAILKSLNHKSDMVGLDRAKNVDEANLDK